MKAAYITRASKFFPNEGISNDELEEYLGKIKGRRSKSKAIVLRNNGIKNRYYALDKNGNCTHTNAEIAVEAIKRLTGDGFTTDDIQLLTCGTASPDQMMPSHSSMVHGLLGGPSIDAMTATGSCNSAMWAFNYAYMSVLLGQYRNAVCCGSEKISAWMMSHNFEEELAKLEELEDNPYLAFEKDFLRWMLSDGAAAVLIEEKPSQQGISLKINWIEIRSYANEAKTCMYAGGVLDENGDLIPWRNMTAKSWLEQSVFSLKQDTRLLEKNITRFGGLYLRELMDKHAFNSDDVDYFLPHMSSEFFRKNIHSALLTNDIEIPPERWFTNLHKVGNVGAASGFLMLEELFNTKDLQPGQNVLLMIPESARFSYTYVYMTVVQG